MKFFKIKNMKPELKNAMDIFGKILLPQIKLNKIE